jgi:hypothetical protein
MVKNVQPRRMDGQNIRDFTTVSEHIEPEEVIAMLQAYHKRIGGLVAQHRGTIGYRAGDANSSLARSRSLCDPQPDHPALNSHPASSARVGKAIE